MQADVMRSPIAPAPKSRPGKISVDLTPYPDLVVVYLGFRVASWRGLATLFNIGPKLSAIQRDKPDGLLCHETVVFALNHIGMRQYWRDMGSLEAFTRSDPHKTWWKRYGKDAGGAGFWHEAYRRTGGIEGLYIGMGAPVGLAAFAPAEEAVGRMATSRGRLAA